MKARYVFIKQLFFRRTDKCMDNSISNLFTVNLFSWKISCTHMQKWYIQVLSTVGLHSKTQIWNCSASIINIVIVYVYKEDNNIYNVPDAEILVHDIILM